MSRSTLFASAFKSAATLFAADEMPGPFPTPTTPTLAATGSVAAAVEVGDDGVDNAVGVAVVAGAAPPARFSSAVVVMEKWLPSALPSTRDDGCGGVSPHQHSCPDNTSALGSPGYQSGLLEDDEEEEEEDEAPMEV